MEEILEAQKEESQAQPLPAKAPKGLKEAKIGNIALFIALLSVCLIPFVYFFIGIIGKHTIPNSNIYLSVFLTLFSLFCVPLLFYEKTLFGDLNLKKKNILALMPIILLLAFLVWGIISTIFAPDKQLALFDYPARAEGLFMYFGYGIIFMGAMLLKKENFKRLIIYSFLIIMAFFCVFWVIDYLFFSRAYSFMGFNFTFPWANSNHAGYMLTISSLLAGSLFVFEEKKKSIKILALIGFGLFVLCGYFNNTLGCQIATFVALIMLTIIALTKNLFNYEKLIVLWVVFAGVTLLDAFLIKARRTVYVFWLWHYFYGRHAS